MGDLIDDWRTLKQYIINVELLSLINMSWLFAKKETVVDPIRVDEPKQSESKFGGVISFLDEKIVQKIESKTNSLVESTQNYQLGIIIFITGVFFFGLSLVFLPFMIIQPYKFCALNGFGTFSIFLSLVFIRGNSVLRTLFGKKKIFYTFLFFSSFICEIYFSVINPSYVLVLLSFLVHFASIAYLLFSLVPGGIGFLNTVFSSAWSFFKFFVGNSSTGNQYV